MLYYSVLEVTPTDEAWIPGYLEAANALVAKHGGRYLARTATHQRLEGEKTEAGDAALRIILEWPAREAAEAFMQDPDYLPHLQARTAGSISHHYLVASQDDLA